MKQKKPLIVLTGPTAVGKTKLSIELAKAVNGEIISADSMQVYRYMDIGSAKIKKEETEGIPHHLIDILKPTEAFNVVIFQKLVKKAILEIYGRGKIPILTGGTGFYIQSVLYDIDFTENDENTVYREELLKLAEENGSSYLHDLLKEVDQKAAEEIHPNNIKRMIRALEFHQQTNSMISEHNEKEKLKNSNYASCYFVLNDDRDKIYARIEERVDQMIEDGLVEEVKHLVKMGCKREMVSMQGIGYKEILSFLADEISLDEAISDIKKNSRHFAKRQITWFRREKDVCWLGKPDFSYDEKAMLSFMVQKIEETFRKEDKDKDEQQ